jgi:hypothetical protein
MDGIASRHSVAVQQVIKQAGQRRKLSPDGCGRQHSALEVSSPSKNMGALNLSELVRMDNADESGEIADIDAVGSPGLRIINVGQPLGSSWHLR